MSTRLLATKVIRDKNKSENSEETKRLIDVNDVRII